MCRFVKYGRREKKMCSRIINKCGPIQCGFISHCNVAIKKSASARGKEIMTSFSCQKDCFICWIKIKKTYLSANCHFKWRGECTHKKAHPEFCISVFAWLRYQVLFGTFWDIFFMHKTNVNRKVNENSVQHGKTIGREDERREKKVKRQPGWGRCQEGERERVREKEREIATMMANNSNNTLHIHLHVIILILQCCWA